MLESLDDSFDSHLAQAENLSALFVAMNDEVFEIRELAICTIGRLSCMNPAYVMPSLRKTLIQVRFFSTSVMYVGFECFFCHSYVIYLLFAFLCIYV